MDIKLILTFFTLVLIIYVDGKKSFSSRGSGSGRGTSRKTNHKPQPVPTSLSYPQQPASAPKPSLFGWQERPKNAQPQQTKPSSSQSHSYPSSHSGMSGNNPPKQPPPYQESVQRSSASQNLNGQPAAPRPANQATNNQAGHSYPASTGLSGSSGSGYPQQGSGLSGTGVASHQQPQQKGNSYPQGTGLSGAGAAPPPYPGNSNGGTYQGSNHAYQHPPPPPPYSNVGPNYGSNYGGYGGHGPVGGYGGHGGYNPGYNPQSPGYFGNYANNGNRGYGGVSRSGNVLTGVGIAGAGVGTILTGLALWNLARSTGHRQHTVIYDNRGQPVAVAPPNNMTSVIDPILADLVNCTLSIDNGNTTEVLAIPCSIATSFTPDADVKDLGSNSNAADNTKCIVTVVNKAGREFMTTIPCSTLFNTAAENNVTEPVLEGNMPDSVNGTMVASTEFQLASDQLQVLNENGTTISPNNPQLNCTSEPGEVRDPINPCFAITHNITVAPLQPAEISEK